MYRLRSTSDVDPNWEVLDGDGDIVCTCKSIVWAEDIIAALERFDDIQDSPNEEH